LPKCF